MLTQDRPITDKTMCYTSVQAYVFNSDSEHKSVTGLEQPDGFLVGHSNQTVPIDIDQFITNLKI